MFASNRIQTESESVSESESKSNRIEIGMGNTGSSSHRVLKKDCGRGGVLIKGGRGFLTQNALGAYLHEGNF